MDAKGRHRAHSTTTNRWPNRTKRIVSMTSSRRSIQIHSTNTSSSRRWPPSLRITPRSSRLATRPMTKEPTTRKKIDHEDEHEARTARVARRRDVAALFELVYVQDGHSN